MGTIVRYKYLFVVNDRMKRVIAVHTLFDSQPDGPLHRRMGSSNGGRGCVFQFSGGRMTSRGQCPRGGACEIPPFRKSCIRACYLCKILGNQPLRPPNQSVPIRLWSSACMHVCIYICMYVYIVTCLTSWY